MILAFSQDHDHRLQHLPGILKLHPQHAGWKKNGHSVWVFFNNDLHGYAIDNARTLKDLVG